MRNWECSYSIPMDEELPGQNRNNESLESPAHEPSLINHGKE